MVGRSRLLLVAAVVTLAGAAPWFESPQPQARASVHDTTSVLAPDGPETVLAAAPRLGGPDSSPPRPYAIGLALTGAYATLLAGALLARRITREAHRVPRWIACAVRAPPAFRFA